MSKLFGTDGVRGVANRELTPELAFELGRAGAQFLQSRAKKIVIGRDTRRSGDLLEAALVSGICAAGTNAVLLGVIPTPAVAYLTRQLGADGGAVISASHNPSEYNGIKFFDDAGIKLSEAQEEKIEKLIEDGFNDRPVGNELGISSNNNTAVERYVNHVVDTIFGDLEGMKVAIDCANGAAFKVAPEILGRLGVRVIPFSVSPNGANINKSCGSTHPHFLKEIVKSRDVDVGFALDGDADRVIAIDETGEVVDGDFIMAICAAHLDELNLLEPKALVTTVMTNVGLDRSMKARGIDVIKTPVGDRFVLQEMLDDKVMIGGEQSGHIIFLNHNTTGDGIITALQLLSVIRDSGKPLSELKQVMTRFPQALKNIEVTNGEKGLIRNHEVVEAVTRCERELGVDGRVLVRSSGTEPLVRIMVEAKTQDQADYWTEIIGLVIEEIKGSS